MRGLIAAALFCLLAACDAQPPVASGEAASPAPEAPVDAGRQRALTAVLQACPGLTEYAGDWTTVEIRAEEPGRAGGVEILVNETGLKKIPGDFYAMGHHCFFEVGGDRPDRVSVAKRPCVSVCTARRFTGPSSTDIEIR